MVEQKLELMGLTKMEGPDGEEQLAVVRLLDGSMLPEFFPGDILVFSTDLESAASADYFLRIRRGTLGGCFVREDNGWEFLNSKYEAIQMPDQAPEEEALYDSVVSFHLKLRIPVGREPVVLTSGPIREASEAVQTRQPASL